MLVANLQVSDGLSNGVMGIIKGIIAKENIIQSIQVSFPDSVGTAAKMQNPHQHDYPGCVHIQRHQVSFTYGKGNTVQATRSQFPLTVSFANAPKSNPHITSVLSTRECNHLVLLFVYISSTCVCGSVTVWIILLILNVRIIYVGERWL